MKIKKAFIKSVYHFFISDNYYGSLKFPYYFLIPKAKLILKDAKYSCYRESWDRGSYFLCKESNQIFRAIKPTGTGTNFLVSYESYNLQLKSVNFYTFEYELWNDDNLLGFIKESHAPYEYEIELKEKFEPLFQIFIFYLSVCTWSNERIMGSFLLRA